MARAGLGMKYLGFIRYNSLYEKYRFPGSAIVLQNLNYVNDVSRVCRETENECMQIGEMNEGKRANRGMRFIWDQRRYRLSPNRTLSACMLREAAVPADVCIQAPPGENPAVSGGRVFDAPALGHFAATSDNTLNETLPMQTGRPK